MARIRTIKPAHVNDKELPSITLHAHLFWVLSWCFSDDEGVMENDPLLLKSQIFPRRTDIRVDQVQGWIDQLVKARYIIPFEYENEGYLLHRTFKTHQKIDRPQPSKIPENVIRRLIAERSTNVRPCKGEESIGEEGRGITPAPDLSNSNLYRKPKIPTFEEVHRVFISQGGTEEMAKKFFEQNESTGWFYKNSPITNFASQVPGFIKSWKENLVKNGSSKTGKSNFGKATGTVNALQLLKKNIEGSNS